MCFSCVYLCDPTGLWPPKSSLGSQQGSSGLPFLLGDACNLGLESRSPASPAFAGGLPLHHLRCYIKTTSITPGNFTLFPSLGLWTKCSDFRCIPNPSPDLGRAGPSCELCHTGMMTTCLSNPQAWFLLSGYCAPSCLHHGKGMNTELCSFFLLTTPVCGST